MSEKILVIDDEPNTLRLMTITLQRQGYQVLTANDGVQGIEMARKEYPDLIILDLMMPGMNGFEVTRTLRDSETTHEIPILIFSARSQLEDKIAGYEAGIDDYLTKPVHPAELVTHIRNLLQRSKKQEVFPAKLGYMVGVISAKGGVGVSSLTFQLAVSYQQKTNTEVLAVEMRPGHGNWKMRYAPSSINGLEDLLRLKPHEITIPMIENELIQNSFGPRLLLSSNRLRDVELLKATEQVEALVKQLPQIGGLVLLDFGTILWSNYEKILSFCQEIILLTEPYDSTAHFSSLLINELVEKGFGQEKPLTIVAVACQHAEAVLTTEHLQEILRQPIALMLTPCLEEETSSNSVHSQQVQMEQSIQQLAEQLDRHVQMRPV